MEFSNPFDDPQGQFAFAQCAGAVQPVAATMPLPAGWDIVCQPAVAGRHASSGWKSNWRTLTAAS